MNAGEKRLRPRSLPASEAEEIEIQRNDATVPATAAASYSGQSHPTPYGALPGEWEKLGALGLIDDLLPVVSDPTAVPAPESTIKQPGKLPSTYRRDGHMVGFAKWTEHHTTPRDVAKWSKDDRLGICLNTRLVRAIDVDVEDLDEAIDIEIDIAKFLGVALPIRRRSNSSKFLVLFKMPGDFTKRRFKTAGGVIEFLAGRQQAVVCGTHPSGVRYEFDGGLPDHIPQLSDQQFEDLWALLNAKFGTEASVEARKGIAPVKPRSMDDVNDPLVDYLEARGLVLDYHRSGRLDITCPFADDHTTDTGDTATSYYPAGVGGFDRGHYKCLHAHCMNRTDGEFKDAIGWSIEGFEELPEPTPEEADEQAEIMRRNNLQAERMAQKAIDKAKFTEGRDALENARREHQRRENEQIGEGEHKIPTAEVISLETALHRYVFLSDGSRVADIFNPHYDMALSDWKSTYAASKEIFPQPDKVLAGGRKEKVADKEIPVARLWVESPRRQTAVCRTFKAGGPLILLDPEGRPAVNSWRPYSRSIAVPDPVAAGVNLFIDHIRFLFGLDADRFLDWLAHIEQSPGILPHTAWLHIAKNFGMGRNWLASVLARVWAGSVAPNLDLVEMFDKGFNGRLSRKVIAIVDEIREGGRDTQWAHAEKLKSIITEESRLINPKYGRQSVEYNACRWLMFSQHLSAIPMEKGDRRIEVVVTEGQPKTPAYYSTLYAALNNPLFIAAVAKFLGERDISTFNPGAHATNNEAKQQATKASQTPMAAQCEALVKYWPSDLITAADLYSVLEQRHAVDDTKRCLTSAHRKTLEQYGIVALGKPIKVDANPVRLSIVRNKAKWQGADNDLLREELRKAESENDALDVLETRIAEQEEDAHR
ncbi:hypothetical protein GBK02_10020 [Dechloromonas sp. TW-R-39-2]|uniref:DUF5906 domain-containing protein n=1 Tax=Dechloromonas sp. TW-R-39-2 TaxID=2654218 RepID=UPI00193D1811|nr:DUF5906 domain-containing protein [Dechloromonas sp. TW-R-39-2]QRM19714.1 hypothetical protein GBK02_10020 [Dechloromonas sp. TW-R-39-2]